MILLLPVIKKTQEFNILDMPIEIEGSTLMFTDNELELSGIEVLNEESLLTNSENYIIDSNVENFNLDLVIEKNVCSNIFGNVINKSKTSVTQVSTGKDSKNCDTICNENYNTNISSAVKNPTKCLYNIDKVDSENIYELVENTIKFSGVIKIKKLIQIILLKTQLNKFGINILNGLKKKIVI